MYEHEPPPADAEADDLQKDKDDWAAPVPVAYSAKKEVTNEESLMSITEKICCNPNHFLIITDVLGFAFMSFRSYDDLTNAYLGFL